MTGPHNSEPMPYETKAPNAYSWTLGAFDRMTSGVMRWNVVKRNKISTVTVSGACPRCEHDVNFTQVLDAVAGEASGTLSVGESSSDDSPDDFVEVAAACRCGGEHPNRPDDIPSGCGINFMIDIEIK